MSSNRTYLTNRRILASVTAWIRAIANRTVFKLLSGTVELWIGKNAFQHAGALAFYTLFSMAPLLVIVITITGIVFGEEAARGEIALRLNHMIGEQGAGAIEEAVRRSRIDEAGLLPSLLGIGALLFAATTVFAQMQTSLNQFWGVVAKPSRSSILVFLTTRLLSLGLVLIIGFLLLTSFLISMSLQAILRFARDWIPVPPLASSMLDLAVSVLIAALLFGMIFKVLPDVRLRWRHMWRGAFLTSMLFVLGQYGISIYLTQAAPASTYGAAGSLVLVLFWVYYSALILFFGAAFTKVYTQHQGDPIVPKPAAVLVREVFEGADATASRPV